MLEFEQLLAKHGYTKRFHEFHHLMRHRVNEILLVSSLYDSFILEEDGRLYEMILSEYIDLNLSHAPGLTRASSGEEAIRMAGEEARLDLIITTMNLGDMNAFELARKVREVGLKTPAILLTYAADDAHRWNRLGGTWPGEDDSGWRSGRTLLSQVSPPPDAAF